MAKVTRLEQKRLMKAITEVMLSNQYVDLVVPIRNVFLALTSIQYAWRDPSLTPDMKFMLRDFGDYLGSIISDVVVGTDDLIASGWDITKDVERDETETPSEK